MVTLIPWQYIKYFNPKKPYSLLYTVKTQKKNSFRTVSYESWKKTWKSHKDFRVLLRAV
jgi:hypothetical protein